MAAALVLASPAVPGPVGEPGRRLVNTQADSRDPLWDRELDGDALRDAGRRVPDDVTYFVDAAGADPVLQGNLKAAGQLFLAPALPVRDRAQADWVLRYERGRITVEEQR